MADYLDDNLDGVETKTDTNTGTSSHLIRSADINAHTEALDSLRRGITGGKYTPRFNAQRAAYGAVGNGTAVDNTALAVAMGAANTAGGADVFIPNGTYRLTSSLLPQDGVTLVGESRDGCILLIDHADATTDGIVFPSNGSSYRVGGGLRNLTVKATSQSTCRDCVSVNLRSGFKIENVTILNAGRHGVYVGAGLDIKLEDVKAEHCKTSGLYVEDQSGVISTTVRADGSYFRDTTEGAGVDVACNGIVFSKCYFESNGSTTRSAGVGARVRSGQAIFSGPYFENNAVWDVDAGTDSSSTAQVIINGFSLVSGGYKQSGYGGFRFDYCNAGNVSGGLIPAMSKSIVFRANCAGVNADVKYTSSEPEWEGSGGIAKYPGFVRCTDASTGQTKLEGNYAVRIGGGPQLQSTFLGTATYTGATVANGAVDEVSVTVTGANTSDAVVGVAMGGDVDTGFTVSAYVAAPNTVKVRFHNGSGGSSSVSGPRTLRVLVARYS